MTPTADEVLDFWFIQSGPNKWYMKSDAFDAEIRRLYEDASIDAAAHLRAYGTHPWLKEPHLALALILMLDQFSRNMYRDTKAAFAWDMLALQSAIYCVDVGYDLKVGQDKRAFFYLPYMHAEDLSMQDECVRLMDCRIDRAGSLHHAKEHRKVIQRFGRFPHRNQILERESTAAELAFLRDGGYVP